MDIGHSRGQILIKNHKLPGLSKKSFEQRPDIVENQATHPFPGFIIADL
jgi:hypothetical protein